MKYGINKNEINVMLLRCSEYIQCECFLIKTDFECKRINDEHEHNEIFNHSLNKYIYFDHFVTHSLRHKHNLVSSIYLFSSSYLSYQKSALEHKKLLWPIPLNQNSIEWIVVVASEQSFAGSIFLY